MGQLTAMMQALADSDEMIDESARYIRKLFCAYLAQGFTEDQAMQLTVAAATSAMPMPSTSAS